MDDHISTRLEQAMDRLASALERHGFAPELESAANQKRRDYLGEPIARSYDFEDAGPALNRTTRAIDPSSTLGMIAERIHKFGHDARQIGYKLAEHADAVHGPAPEDTGNRASASHAGMSSGIGNIVAALDAADDALGFLALQAGRNATLA